MKYNNKGLSTIVATLIIIILVLVAVGIIWMVVRGVIRSGSNQIDINAQCIEAEISATRVVSGISADTYNVTLTRTGGENEIGGVKLVFTNADESGNFVSDLAGNIAPLETKTQIVTVLPSDVANASKVSVIVYFKDESGAAQLCQPSSELEF